MPDCFIAEHMFLPCCILHLQDTVPKEDLLESLYLEFVNRVNEVGVDINQVLAFPYTAPLLQFVCGLGPRKASQIIKVSSPSQVIFRCLLH